MCVFALSFPDPQWRQIPVLKISVFLDFRPTRCQLVFWARGRSVSLHSLGGGEVRAMTRDELRVQRDDTGDVGNVRAFCDASATLGDAQATPGVAW